MLQVVRFRLLWRSEARESVKSSQGTRPSRVLEGKTTVRDTSENATSISSMWEVCAFSVSVSACHTHTHTHSLSLSVSLSLCLSLTLTHTHMHTLNAYPRAESSDYGPPANARISLTKMKRVASMGTGTCGQTFRLNVLLSFVCDFVFLNSVPRLIMCLQNCRLCHC